MFTKNLMSRSLVETAMRCCLNEADIKTAVKHKKEKVTLLKKQWKELKGSAAEAAKKYELNKKKLDKEEAGLEELRSVVEKAYEQMQKASEEEKIVNREIVELLGELDKLNPGKDNNVEQEPELEEEGKDKEEGSEEEKEVEPEAEPEVEEAKAEDEESVEDEKDEEDKEVE